MASDAAPPESPERPRPRASVGPARALLWVAGAGLLLFAAWRMVPGDGRTQAGALEGDGSYRIEFEAQPPASRDASGQIRLSVRPLKDWHLAPEAPAMLRLEDADGLSFDTAVRVEPTAPADRKLDFHNGFRCAGAGAFVVRGRVEFGMCKGDSLHCIIIQRDLELPLEIAPPD